MIRRRLAIVLGFLAVSGSATALAALPAWADLGRRTSVTVSDCANRAAAAVKAVTGKAPTVLTLDTNAKVVRGFTANGGIIVHCTASPAKVCGETAADLQIVTFSSANDAFTLRDGVNSKFGNPAPIDCGSVANPI